MLRFLLTFCRQLCRSDLGHVTVHIPFYVGNRGAVEYLADCIHHVLAYIRTGKIQYQLIPAARTCPSCYMQAPVRMLLIKLAFRRDHLRLKP